MRGARDVTAVDVSRRAVWTARINARLNHTRIRGVRGNLFDAVGDRRFDAIVSNPPYVPAESDELPARGPQRAWDAGLTGRLILDRICDDAPHHLRPGGFVLLVHSSVCDADQTVERLRAGGLDTDVIARQRGPLGPLLTARVSALEARGLLARGAARRRCWSSAAGGPSGARTRRSRTPPPASPPTPELGPSEASDQRRRLRRLRAADDCGAGAGSAASSSTTSGSGSGSGWARAWGSIPFARMRASRISCCVGHGRASPASHAGGLPFGHCPGTAARGRAARSTERPAAASRAG